MKVGGLGTSSSSTTTTNVSTTTSISTRTSSSTSSNDNNDCIATMTANVVPPRVSGAAAPTPASMKPTSCPDRSDGAIPSDGSRMCCSTY